MNQESQNYLKAQATRNRQGPFQPGLITINEYKVSNLFNLTVGDKGSPLHSITYRSPAKLKKIPIENLGLSYRQFANPRPAPVH